MAKNVSEKRCGFQDDQRLEKEDRRLKAVFFYYVQPVDDTVNARNETIWVEEGIAKSEESTRRDARLST